MCSQVNRPVPESSPLGQASGGFALVIALGLMAFVLLILLSITTLVQVESQDAATRIDRLKAEQAALLSLNNAIGKLQQTAGLDKRVTAPAMAVDTVNGPR
jgi:Tfp pilus assembly protein PilX